MSADGHRVYLADFAVDSVSVVDTSVSPPMTRATFPVGDGPSSLALTPDGSRMLVTTQLDHTVSVVDTASHAVIATIPVGLEPGVVGDFIGPDVFLFTSDFE